MQSVERTLSAAEVLEIRDGRIVRGELFYDAEAAADAAMSSASCAPMFRLIDLESMLFLHGQPPSRP
jgi:hypothetical protein